eukprot:s2135_g15.t1
MGVTKEVKKAHGCGVRRTSQSRFCEAGDGKTFPKAGDLLRMPGLLRCLLHEPPPEPAFTKSLRMHYTGRFASSGQVFDSSQGKEPLEFTAGIGQVIRGEKAILLITSDFAYGRAGMRGVIPPNANLVFEVELLDINPTEKYHPKDRFTRAAGSAHTRLASGRDGPCFELCLLCRCCHPRSESLRLRLNCAQTS